MAKRNSPLNPQLISGHYGAVGSTGVYLSARWVSDLWQIAGWQNFDQSAGSVLNRLGFDNPGNYSHFQQTHGRSCWRIAPDKILIENAGDLSNDMTEDLVTLDLSHARIALLIRGRQSRDTLSQMIDVDISSDTFSPGQFIQTAIHHVAVLIQCTGEECFEIFVPVSWVDSVAGFICRNAEPYGYEIERLEL